jgi:hypothetical protein
MQSGNGWHRWSNCKLQGECWSSVKAGAKRLWGTVIQSENCVGALCLSFYNDLFHVCNWVVTGFPSVLLMYPSGHCMCIVECCFKGKSIWQLLHRSYSIFCWCRTWYELGFFHGRWYMHYLSPWTNLGISNIMTRTWKVHVPFMHKPWMSVWKPLKISKPYPHRFTFLWHPTRFLSVSGFWWLW